MTNARAEGEGEARGGRIYLCVGATPNNIRRLRRKKSTGRRKGVRPRNGEILGVRHDLESDEDVDDAPDRPARPIRVE